MMELFFVLNEKEMPKEWQTIELVQSAMGKGGAKNCSAYSRVKLWEHTMKGCGRVLLRKIQATEKASAMHFGYITGTGRQMHDL